MNFIEIRNEYITHLSDNINQYIYQGFQSIYDNAVNYKKKNKVEFDELRIFQDLLRNIIPNWNNIILDREVARIKICSKKGDTLDLLLKMILKAHIHIHTNNLSESQYLKPELYENINFTDFIHKVYINSAREFFNNPFLFTIYEVSPKEIKMNQKEALEIIKNSIVKTIKNLIPIELFLYDFKECCNVNVKLLTDEALPSVNINNIKRLELDKKSINEKQEGGEIPLINTVGQNVMDKVFSSFNIKETLPNLVDANDVESVISISNYKSHHTISNFLKEPPPQVLTESIKQSAIEEYDAIYNND